MIAIIDYGLGNRGSIFNMLRRLGYESIISSDHSIIENADKLILPGVGSFDTGMKNLDDLGLISLLNKKVLQDKVPVLGICLGMQLLSRCSEEGQLAGLGWIDATTVKFDLSKAQIRIPHMGWNFIKFEKKHYFFENISEPQRFYFVHSYHLHGIKEDEVLCTTGYGYDFVSGVTKGNIIGVQFHPEKSHKFGMHLLQQFANRE